MVSSLAVQGTLKSLLHHSLKASLLWDSAFSVVQLSHPYMTTGKTTALTRQNFVGKVTSLLFNMLSRLVITFLPRSNSFNFMAAVTIRSDFGAQEDEICHYFHLVTLNLLCSNGAKCHDLSFLLIFSLKPDLSLSSFTFIKRLFSSSLLSAIRVVSSAYLS